MSNSSNIKQVAPPAGYAGEGFFATKLSEVVGLARANSMWPLPFATSCCGIEYMATMAATYDIGRFGSERMSFSPRQADMLLDRKSTRLNSSHVRISYAVFCLKKKKKKHKNILYNRTVRREH